MTPGLGKTYESELFNAVSKAPHSPTSTYDDLRYFNKYESYLPHPDYPLVDTSARGKTGPIRVGYNNFVTKPSQAFIKSCVNVGIPFNPDFNGPQGTMGVSRVSEAF
jgi:hypothetical protein